MRQHLYRQSLFSASFAVGRQYNWRHNSNRVGPQALEFPVCTAWPQLDASVVPQSLVLPKYTSCGGDGKEVEPSGCHGRPAPTCWRHCWTSQQWHPANGCWSAERRFSKTGWSGLLFNMWRSIDRVAGHLDRIPLRRFKGSRRQVRARQDTYGGLPERPIA
jgi:hypothetical protein